MKNVYYVPVTFTVLADNPEEARVEARSYLAIGARLIEREAVRGAEVGPTARVWRARFPEEGEA